MARRTTSSTGMPPAGPRRPRRRGSGRSSPSWPKYVMEILFIGGVGLMTVVVYISDPTSRALTLVALFAAAGFRVMPSVVRAMAALTSVRAGRSAVDLVLTDVRASLDHDAHQGVRTGIRLESALELPNVSFAYDNGVEVLRDVDLVVPRGTSIALVGGSGAGKTTLVDLMAGFHRPRTGEILRDGSTSARR